MEKDKIEEIITSDFFDFIANIGEKKPSFIRTKSYLEGVLAREKNKKAKKQIEKFLEDFEMYEGLFGSALQLIKKQSELEDKIKELKHETEKNHNSNLEKIVKLGKGLDRLEKKYGK